MAAPCRACWPRWRPTRRRCCAGRSKRYGWTRETGFLRRSVSPPARGFAGEVLEGELPAGSVIAYDAPAIAGLEQHVLMLDGRMDLTVEGRTHRLAAGDSLRFRLFGPTRFVSPGPGVARYMIAVIQP